MNDIFNGEGVVFQNAFYNMSSGELINPVHTQNYSIVQVADSYYPSELHIIPHTQCCDAEITLVVYGSMKIKADKTAAELKRGEAHLCFFGESHELICRSGVRFQTLAFNVAPGSDAAALLRALRSEGKRVYKSHRLFDILSGIISEFHDTGFAFRLLNLDSLISSALIELIYPRKEKVSAVRYSAEQLAAKTMNCVDQSDFKSESLSELSVRLGYSYNHIYKTFKRNIGESLRDYQIRAKMERAKLLLEENKSISEVACEMGYSTPYNFSRAFKKHFGISPSKVKKQEWH